MNIRRNRDNILEFHLFGIELNLINQMMENRGIITPDVIYF